MDSQHALIIVETAIGNEIHAKIDRLSFGDALTKQRIIECYAQLPNKDGLSHEQLDLLAWAVKANPHRILDNSPKKKPTAIEGYLSLALAECSLVCNALAHGDLIEAQTLLSDATKNLTRAQEEIKKRSQGARGGYKANKENRGIENDAVQYYQDHRSEFATKDEAATYISKFVVPGTSTRTVRDYLKGK